MEEAVIDNPPGRDYSDAMLRSPTSAEGDRPLLQNTDDRRDGEHPSITIHEPPSRSFSAIRVTKTRTNGDAR